ncbi:MAG TPA: hypothetical protein VFK03_04790, partial [Candidatus Saccharimonadales bacterium]|nr:hypothetical protein [Candidatus Saccharimonadales bacterium]
MKTIFRLLKKRTLLLGLRLALILRPVARRFYNWRRQLMESRFGKVWHRVERRFVPLGRRLDSLWRTYLGWRWQKTATRMLAVFSMITLSLVTYSAFAATSTGRIVANADISNAWPSCNDHGNNLCPAGMVYSLVDEGSPVDNQDWISTGNSTAGGESVTF